MSFYDVLLLLLDQIICNNLWVTHTVRSQVLLQIHFWVFASLGQTHSEILLLFSSFARSYIFAFPLNLFMGPYHVLFVYECNTFLYHRYQKNKKMIHFYCPDLHLTLLQGWILDFGWIANSAVGSLQIFLPRLHLLSNEYAPLNADLHICTEFSPFSNSLHTWIDFFFRRQLKSRARPKAKSRYVGFLF